MVDNFGKSIAFVLDAEGGYVNNPDDPGGETNYGISKRAYPNIDIKNLSVGEAKDIYHRDYWLPSGCDKLAWPMCLVQLDTAVNMGVGKANNIIRRVDSSYKGVNAYLAIRKDYYEAIAAMGSNARFLGGWLNRLGRLNKYIQSHKEATNG
ncbi:glycoside hydrolase family 108 protein [Candidatus Magnetominusculus dajiuhuensis]|uniref:glycoside hydrolase family 108 protein n=1 Tax=Candidatus Magnetominusculus dajiuhuensis TaxID=3137712 RepID=UPI003B43B54F